MPKFRLPIFPFLFAVYPLFAPLGRHPGELPPHKENRIYFSPQPRLYDFTDITDEIEASCSG